jgi:ribosome maturation factor RimP
LPKVKNEDFKEGNEIRSLLIYKQMNNQTQIENIRAMVNEFLQTQPEYFCVNVRIKPTNNIKIYVDGDNGISIGACALFNKKIYQLIEEKNWYPDGNFSLEISSPGIEEPLMFYRQYVKNKGRFVEVIMTDGQKKQGKLIAATPENFIIERTEGKGKKAQQIQETIFYSNIKTTTVQIKF